MAKSAEQYFQGEATADKGVDLLIEIVPWAIGHGKTLIGRAEVLEFVREKTSIPLGAIGGDEREKLLQLESRLHERVIGQELAIKSISGALRRSRTGVRNEKRPIGSFLFLGPTGVGKTETAKALATVIFGREETMMRLDMSEFQGADALNRLIGSFAENKAGILANLLRQTSYGVLLLDEFEKTHRDVLNLFLQILDEGFFSDMSGKRVNARNIIFIATSNAGADLVWKMVGKDIDPSTRRDELINHLVGSGAFRPELLNRFDDIIIFHPLSAVQLAAVAKLLLERLRQRLRERGIDFVINSPLVEQVVALGTNQLFGARPMLRFIQDNLEQKIADSLIRGDLSAGSKIEFNNNLEIIISR